MFDKANELQIEKFQLGWKVDSKTFPTSYPAPDSDIGKASKSLLKKHDLLSQARDPSDGCDPSGGCLQCIFSTGATRQVCATCQAVFPQLISELLKPLLIHQIA